MQTRHTNTAMQTDWKFWVSALSKIVEKEVTWSKCTRY